MPACDGWDILGEDLFNNRAKPIFFTEYLVTVQREDTILIDGQSFALKRSSSALFDPRDWGLHPVRVHMFNARGYHFTAAINDGLLTLQQLQVSTAQQDCSPINGQPPQRHQRHGVLYTNIDLPLSFQGTLTAAADFDARHQRSGLRPLEGYRTVISLTLQNGRVTNQHRRLQDTTPKPHGEGQQTDHLADLLNRHRRH